VTVVPNTPQPFVAPTLAPTSSAATLAPTAEPTPQPSATPQPRNEGRAPWILLPQPAPGTRVAPGPTTIEARGRGDAAISEIRLELDGTALPSTLEQRGESTWRGFATARLAVVVDEQGRSGSYRWTFEASP
jgi:hypothetical protein